MRLLFIQWNEKPWFDDVLQVALARCGCDITVVSDRKENKPHPVQWIDVREMSWPHWRNLAEIRGEFFGGSIYRWFLLRGLLDAKAVEPPLFVPDWDDVILCDLTKACEPFQQYTYATTWHCGIKRAPMLINKASAVRAFCDFIESLLYNNSPRLWSVQDSSGWSVMAAAHDFRVGNLCEIQNNSVFDHSIAFGAEDGYIMHNGLKKIDWFGPTAWFYMSPGRGVVANSIQCWGEYKRLIPKFRKLAIG